MPNSLFIATGSNLGNRKHHLSLAQKTLSEHFIFIAASRIYESPAVDYLNQPDFYNQVLEFAAPKDKSPEDVIKILLDIELQMGRDRLIPKGPRNIDIDLLFWDDLKWESETLSLPHPRLFERSFVVLPLSELPGFIFLEKKFNFKFSFDNFASPIS